MKNANKILLILILALSFTSQNVYAQYTSKKVKSVHQAYTDSLKTLDYNYVFPFWGQGAYSKGFDIPYPIGFMANYFWTDQGIAIDNFQLGFENAYNPDNSFPLTPLSEDLLTFGDSRNTSYSVNVRPDIWIFPFIDLYGIFGYGNSSTSVNVIFPWMPEENNNFTSIVDQGITTSGFGVLLAGGVGPVWLSLDANMTWNKPELLDKATIVNVVGLRMGKLFVFKKKPHSNVSFWIGTMYIKMQSETLGAIKLADALPQEVWDRKDAWVADYWDWYNNEAGPGEKLIADKVFTPIVNAIDVRDGESVVAYNMDKQAEVPWNFLVGAQYQINKHWQIRSELGIGDRSSFLLSLNYRLLGFKKK